MVKIKPKMNKHGWIKITEAFISILLLAVILLFVVKQSDTGTQKESSDIYNAQLAILREIQISAPLREEILATGTGVIEWDDFPSGIQDKIERKTPLSLDCTAKICPPSDQCILSGSSAPETENIYVEKIMITRNADSDATEYNPRVLKLFCWEI